jgi:hypothetical protein
MYGDYIGHGDSTMALAISSSSPIVILYTGQHETLNKYKYHTSCSSLFLRPSLPPQFCTRRNQRDQGFTRSVSCDLHLNGLFPIVLILVKDGQAERTIGILQVTE